MLVVGLGRTGVAVSLFSAGYGAIVTATDEKPENNRGGSGTASRGRRGLVLVRRRRYFWTGFDRSKPGRARKSSGT